jgi:uncharacterized protein YktA (UPF0223 family)
MLETILKKIEQIYEQCIFHGKYIDHYDAICLSSFTLGENDSTKLNQIIDGNIPSLPSFERLMKDVTHILDEGNILQQQLLIEINSEIQSSVDFPFSVLHNPSSLQTAGLDMEEAVSEKEVKISILHKEIRYNLRRLYECVSEIIEEKLRILQFLNEILDFYKINVIHSASRKGIRKAATKLDLVIKGKVEELLNHRLFSTREVCQLIFCFFCLLLLFF